MGAATKGNEWLLLKHGEDMKPISAKQDDTSALTGHTLAQIRDAHDREWISRRKAHKESNENSGKKSPGTFKNRVATLAKKRASSRHRKTAAPK